MQKIHDKWFVVVTRPRAQKCVGLRLAKCGFENFVPIQRQLKQWSDRKKWVDVPLFYTYIFIKTTDRHRFGVFDIDFRILGYVKIGGQPIILTEPDLEKIRRI